MNSNKSIHKRTNAFTLIELLVVIAVISLIAMLLIPVIGTVRSSAYSTKCSNNLKNIYLSTRLYGEDWEDAIVVCDDKNVKPYTNWMQVLTDWNPETNGGSTTLQVGNKGSVLSGCPYAVQNPNLFSDILLGYGLRLQRKINSSYSSNTNRGKPWFFSEFNLLSQQALIGDSDRRELDITWGSSAEWRIYSAAGPGFDSPYFYPRRHRGGMNIGFFDGHIALINEAKSAMTIFNPALFQP